MRKVYRTAVIAAVLLMCAACSNKNGGEDVTSTQPATEESTPGGSTAESTAAPATAEAETTADPGIMPNTAGIVVWETKAKKAKPERPTRELREEERGTGSVASNCRYLADKDAERLGVSKILVFETLSGCVSNGGVDHDIFSRFNELLVTKYGCDFVVSFLGFSDTGNSWANYSYYDMLSGARELGQQLDIIMACPPAYYSRIVRDGFMEDITDYLMTTEEGKKLYGAYSEECWKRCEREDGRIYGYIPQTTPGLYNVLVCNRELADKLGIKAEEGFSFYDIESMLAGADLSEENIGDVIPVAMSGNFPLRFGYYPLGNGIWAKEDAEGSWTAFNLLEDEQALEGYRTIRKYVEKGWLVKIEGSQLTQKFENGEFIFGMTYAMDEKLADSRLVLSSSSDGKKTVDTVYDVIVGEINYQQYQPAEFMVYGVSTWSEYKDEALKLLTILNTEAELANLLAYGIENDHYTYRDRRIIKLPSYGHGIGTFIPVANPNLTLPVLVEPDNKQEYYREVSSKFEPGPNIDCGIPLDEQSALIKAYGQSEILEQIYEQGIGKLWAGEYEDVDAAAAEIVRMQKEAGIDEVIAVFNERFSKATTQEAQND